MAASRAPIVAILGHVDHGKTSLLSKIKQQDLTRQEAGGISQHIGAYQVKGITFIDTPGHVAFSKMRSRGAKVADLAVLVVAADEGVKPQTLESLKHLQMSKTPFLVAINKIDLPNVNLDWVKGNLAENNILVEGFGGKIVSVPVSAKTGQGIDQLLEMIRLLAQVEGLAGNAHTPLEGVIIESGMDPRQGPVATVLLRGGQLQVGQEFWVGDQRVKIKALLDENGRRVDSISAGQAARVLGCKQVPPVGALVSQEALAGSPQKVPAKKAVQTETQLKVILKTDVAGTLEAIQSSLPDEVALIQTGTGSINESDIELGQTTGAMVIGFNLPLSGKIKKLAEMEGVTVKTYKVIYDLLADLEKKVLRLMEPTIEEEILGQAEILAQFTINEARIAGAKMISGRLGKKDKLHLKRGKKIIGDCHVHSLKIGKTDVEQVKEGDEFGVILKPQLDFTIGDMLVSYQLPAKANGK